MDPVTALLSTTITAYSPKMTENILTNNGLLWLFRRANMKSGGVDMENAPNGEGSEGYKIIEGGSSWSEALMYGKNSTIKTYGVQADYDTDIQEGMSHAKFEQKVAGGTVVFTDLQDKQNRGVSAIYPLIEEKMTQAEISLQDLMGAQLFGDGTGNSGDDIGGLQLLVADSPLTGTVGGIDRATYSWWRNQYSASSVSAFNTSKAGIKAMGAMWLKCKKQASAPNIIVTTDDIWALYAAELEDKLDFRLQDADAADAGFTNVKYRKATVISDDNCPASHMYFLNTKYIFIKVLNGGNFQVTDIEKRMNKRIACLNWYGNMTISNAQRLGVLTRITG